MATKNAASMWNVGSAQRALRPAAVPSKCASPNRSSEKLSTAKPVEATATVATVCATGSPTVTDASNPAPSTYAAPQGNTVTLHSPSTHSSLTVIR